MGNILSKHSKGNRQPPEPLVGKNEARKQQEKLLLGAKIGRCIYEIVPLKTTAMYQGTVRLHKCFMQDNLPSKGWVLARVK